MLNLYQVQVFLTILEAGGFIEAAQKLGCSQPTVSQQLKKLEEALEVQLIVRNRTRPELTAHGAKFLPYARRLMRTAQRARDAIRPDVFAVGASSNIGVYFLQRMLGAFADAQPELPAPTVRIGTNPEIVDQLESGEIDVAVLEWWEPHKGFMALPWRRERLVVITPPDHELARHAAVPVDQLLSTPLLGGEPGSGTGTLLRSVFGDRADAMRVSQSLGSTEAVKRAVRSGMGISLVLEGTVTDEVQHGYLAAVPVKGERLEKEFQIVVPEDTPETAAAWKFVEFLRAHGNAPAELESRDAK